MGDQTGIKQAQGNKQVETLLELSPGCSKMKKAANSMDKVTREKALGQRHHTPKVTIINTTEGVGGGGVKLDPKE